MYFIQISLVFLLFIFIFLFYFLTLQYCIGFAIYQHESATGIHVYNLIFCCICLKFSIIKLKKKKRSERKGEMQEERRELFGKKNNTIGLPWWSSCQCRNPVANACDMGLIPGQKYSTCCKTTEPVHSKHRARALESVSHGWWSVCVPESVFRSKRGQCDEKPETAAEQ